MEFLFFPVLRNYLKIAWRNLRRHKTYAVVNIVGLALGIACCVLLALFVGSEWTYDQFHEKSDRIVRVNRVMTTPSGDTETEASTPALLGSALTQTFPEVEASVRLGDKSVRLTRNDETFTARALFADSSFFEVFSFLVKQGTPQPSFAGAGGIVLSESAAQTYLGSENPMDASFTVQIEDETVEVPVIGVVADPPSRSSIQFDVLLPFELYKYNFSGVMREAAFQRWDVPVASTFALLRQSGQAAALEEKLKSFAADRFGSSSSGGENDLDVHTGEKNVQLALQPLADIHLSPEVTPTTLTAPRDPAYSYVLAGAALLVLLIGGINFTTLSLGRSADRAQEVGVRKAMGARRGQVRAQFWGEAVLTSGAALLLGLGLAALFLPTFNQMTGADLHFHLTPAVGLGLLGLVGIVSLLAGSYPALVLSRFEAVSILRGSTQIGGRSTLVRGLVVVQFALSMGLVVGTFVMSDQLDYMQDNLGFQTEQVVRIGNIGSTQEGKDMYDPFREEVQRLRGVQRVAASNFSFFGSDGMEARLTSATGTEDVTATAHTVDSTFTETLSIDVVQGRGFPARTVANDRAVLVNEALVQAMGWASPVGKTISFGDDSIVGNFLKEATVIGVVENVHTRSMRHRIEPGLFLSNSILGGGVQNIYVRIAPERAGETIDALRQTWTDVVPDRSFEFRFLDRVVDDAYRAEQRQRSVIRAAAGFALLIACFGLFGLAALAVARRTREIGIRKALGATVESVILLFTKDFLRLTGVAFLLAVPVAYWGIRQWLQNFAYRTELGPGLFLGAGGLVVAVALLTVGVQALRAARTDPAVVLREE